MNTRMVNTAADVISRAMQQGRTLPAALAVALDSAQLLQPPDTAAEFEKLLRWHAEDGVTIERQRVLITELRARIAELDSGTEQHAPLAPQEQQPRTILDRARDALDARMSKDDLRHVLSNVIAYAAELERRIEAEECRCPEPAPLCEGYQCRCHTDEQRSAEPADGITRRIAPVQALREASQDGGAR
ncbi:hypothetical protein [Streptomyces thermoviolaceus]|uniref:hypothetical protein n=1 Tax=Streptomyces thermoviolaceus TaxID=1952 RepID=UPI001671B78E|nr:hypothetical protein [Streptomyces thermoviolaceus]GGV80383.1 hypothetical protein GCM10010499_43180 [Streptomyces thermoviolaceus subsp. apingens]